MREIVSRILDGMSLSRAGVGRGSGEATGDLGVAGDFGLDESSDRSSDGCGLGGGARTVELEVMEECESFSSSAYSGASLTDGLGGCDLKKS